MTLLLEYHDSDFGSSNAPHEALGRAARRLGSGGALYLGGGVGIEKLVGAQGAASYSVQQQPGGKVSKFEGPLSAVMHGFSLAGSSTATDTPGGAARVSDPAAAARLRELIDAEAENGRSIERMQRRLARGARQPPLAFMPAGPTSVDDDAYERRRIDELKVEQQQIAAERARLLATGKVEEVEQVRPGANFTKVPAKNVAKLKGIIAHYKGEGGFTRCVADQKKHGLSDDHAKRRCAVVKDLGEGTTKWRRGGKGKVQEELERLLSEAWGRVVVVEETLGAGMSVALVEAPSPGVGASPMVRGLAEGMRSDFTLLALAGHPLALAAFGLEEGVFDEAKHRRDPFGQFAEKIGGLSKAGDKVSMFGVQVSHSGGRGFRVSDLRGDLGKRDDAFTPNAKSAAEMAVGRSLASKDPVSLGGAKSYSSLADLPGAGGERGPNKATARSGDMRIAPETQKGIATQVDGLIGQGLSSRNALARVADRRGMSVAQVRKLHKQHGTERSKLSEAFTSSAVAQAEANVRKAGGTVRRPAPADRGKGTPAVGSFDEKKHLRGKPGTSVGGKFVQSGSSGSEVKSVQHRVGAKTDGEYGQKTTAAVKQFQRSHRLVVDGKVGHQTALALAGKMHKARAAKPGELRDTDREALGKLRPGSKSKKVNGAPNRMRGGVKVG